MQFLDLDAPCNFLTLMQNEMLNNYKEIKLIYLSGSLSAVGKLCLTLVVSAVSLPATPRPFSLSDGGLVGTVQLPAQVAVSVVLSLYPFL